MRHRRSLAERRAEVSRDLIVEAAWELSRQRGLTGWSLRELAQAVGVKAPSLYAYFASKHAIYDAMFRGGYESLDEMASHWTSALESLPPRQAFKVAMRQFIQLCTEDAIRYQLLFQRVIPDFEPSEEAYRASVRCFERFRQHMAHLGVTQDSHLDLWTAISSGLVNQQIANDPGGTRWIRLVDPAVDLFCNYVGIPPTGESPKGAPS